MKIRSQHLNFYTLKAIIKEVKPLWLGKEITSAFSNGVDEIVFEFNSERFPFLRVSNLPKFSYFLPLDNFKKRARNSTELFEELYNNPVEDIYIINQERIIIFEFPDALTLIFKFFGVHSNIILQKEGKTIALFRNKLTNDWQFNLENVGRQEPDELITKENIRKFFPAIDDVLLKFISENYDFPLDIETFNSVEQMIISPPFYISEDWKFLLKAPAEIKAERYELLLKTLKLFVGKYYAKNAFREFFTKITKKLEKDIKFLQKKINSLEKNINKLENLPNYKQQADLILTYSYEIPPNKSEVELFNFYTNKNEIVKIDTKKSITENAEAYYKKHKQTEAKLQHSRKHLEDVRNKMKFLQEKLQEVQSIKNYKELKKWYKNNSGLIETKESETTSNFIEYEYSGYKILVGKTRVSNDELLHIAKKNDLWFHVKDLPSAHVIVKTQDGKVPEIVKEIAGSLSAFYSKAKNNELVLIQYTPRKYLKKQKGELGKVNVMKEETFLINPDFWKKYL